MKKKKQKKEAFCPWTLVEDDTDDVVLDFVHLDGHTQRFSLRYTDPTNIQKDELEALMRASFQHWEERDIKKEEEYIADVRANFVFRQMFFEWRYPDWKTIDRAFIKVERFDTILDVKHDGIYEVEYLSRYGMSMDHIDEYFKEKDHRRRVRPGRRVIPAPL